MNLKELLHGELRSFSSIRVIQERILNILMRHEKKSTYLHVIEPSLGVDRTFLAVLCSAYTIDEVEGENVPYFDFIKSCSDQSRNFPLVKNKPALVERAQEIYKPCKGAGMLSMINQVQSEEDIEELMKLVFFWYNN